jgi:hypothetical protein
MELQTYALIKLAHVLLFVYWLGADIGVFYSAGVVRERALGIEARRTALRILGWIDQIPRYCLVLMLPVGYMLAMQLGVAEVPLAVRIGLWVIAVAWLWAVWLVHHRKGTALAERVRRIDLGWRIVLACGLCWDTYQGFIGRGHLFADWLALKFLLLAAMILCGVAIRVRGAGLGPALQKLFAEGATPDNEAAVTESFRKTRPFVLAIWILLVCAAYTGIAKPSF